MHIELLYYRLYTNSSYSLTSWLHPYFSHPFISYVTSLLEDVAEITSQFLVNRRLHTHLFGHQCLILRHLPVDLHHLRQT